MADPKRYPASDELDYQRRSEEDFPVEARLNVTGEPTTVYAPYATETSDTSDYVGVSPEYMTYANDTEKPLRAGGGVEAEREKAALEDVQFAVATPSPVATDLNTATTGSGASSDLVYTAASGENFTAQKVEAPPEPVVNEEKVEQEPVEVTVPKAATKEPTEPTIQPANTEKRPTDAPPTPVGEVQGASTKARGSKQ